MSKVKNFMYNTLVALENPTIQQTNETFEEIIEYQQKWFNSLTPDEQIGYEAGHFIIVVKNHMKEQESNVLSELKKTLNVQDIVLDDVTFWKITTVD